MYGRITSIQLKGGRCGAGPESVSRAVTVVLFGSHLEEPGSRAQAQLCAVKTHAPERHLLYRTCVPPRRTPRGVGAAGLWKWNENTGQTQVQNESGACSTGAEGALRTEDSNKLTSLSLSSKGARGRGGGREVVKRQRWQMATGHLSCGGGSAKGAAEGWAGTPAGVSRHSVCPPLAGSLLASQVCPGNHVRRLLLRSASGPLETTA